MDVETAAAAVYPEYVAILAERGPLPAAELEKLVTARLEPTGPDPERVIQELDRLSEGDPDLVMLHPDVLVHLPSITAGSVLTHRLSESEAAEGYLLVEPDLDVFGAREGLHVAGGSVEADDHDGPLVLVGPQGWLDAFEPGTLLAVAVAVDGAMTITAVEGVPEAGGLVEVVRAAYDAEIEEAWLPLHGGDLVAAVLARDPAAFAVARPPLGELAAAAGLEERDGELAHEESVFAQAAAVESDYRLAARLEGDDLDAAAESLKVLLDPGAAPAELRDALARLDDPLLLEAVVDELPAELLEPLAARLVALTGQSPRAAQAHWIAAVAAERTRRVLDAESHLRAGQRADPGNVAVADRLAWYQADRGRAREAADLWHGLGAAPDHPDLVHVERFAALPVPSLGRNDPCWCGSGRKVKACHRDEPPRAPLEQRVEWVFAKARGYAVRCAGLELTELVLARANGDDVESVIDDPLVVEALLHEDELWGDFLEERGPLLPDDERELVLTWLHVARAVHEVTVAGEVSTLRRHTSGEEQQVRHVTAPVGTLIAGRVVPDGGGGLRLLPGAFAVAPEHADELAAHLSTWDGAQLLQWVAAHGY